MASSSFWMKMMSLCALCVQILLFCSPVLEVQLGHPCTTGLIPRFQWRGWQHLLCKQRTAGNLKISFVHFWHEDRQLVSYFHLMLITSQGCWSGVASKATAFFLVLAFFFANKRFVKWITVDYSVQLPSCAHIDNTSVTSHIMTESATIMSGGSSQL